MRLRHHRCAALATAPLLAALLLGCSSQGTATAPTPTAEAIEQTTATPDPTPAEEATASSSPDVVIRRIPSALRRQFLNEAYTARTAQWQPQVTDRGRRTTVDQRRVPACDNDPGALRAMNDRLYSEPLSADRSVLDFGADVTTPGDGYVVARQLTLFPDGRTAEGFVREWADPQCFTYQGRFLTGAGQSSRAGRDRFFEVPRPRGGVATRFREGWAAFGGNGSYRYVDILSRVGNALTLTRVADEEYDVKGISVTSSKKENPEFVAQVRSQGRLSVRLLDELTRGRR